MPTRVVRGEIVNSRSLSRVSMEAELLFRNLLALVDDYGRYDGDAEILAAHAFPRRRSVSPDDVEGWLAELASCDDDGTGPVELYVVAGRRYLRLRNWETHRGKSRRGATSRWPQPLDFPCEAQDTASAEIRGEPRSPADTHGDPPEESRSRGVEESGKDTKSARRRAPCVDCPDSLTDEQRDRIAEWASKITPPIERRRLGPAWEVFREWAHGKGERKRDWEAAFRNALLRGWVLVDAGRPPGSPPGHRENAAERRTRENTEAARAALEDFRRREMRRVDPELRLRVVEGGGAE